MEYMGYNIQNIGNKGFHLSNSNHSIVISTDGNIEDGKESYNSDVFSIAKPFGLFYYFDVSIMEDVFEFTSVVDNETKTILIKQEG